MTMVSLNTNAINATMWGAVLRAAKAVLALVTAGAAVISTALAVSPTHTLTWWEVGGALFAGVASHQLVYHAANAAPLPLTTVAPKTDQTAFQPVDLLPPVDLSVVLPPADPNPVSADTAGRHGNV
jgi:hypothetical protein